MNSDDSRPRVEEEASSVDFVDFALTDPVDPRGVLEEPVSPRRMLWLLLLPFGFAFFLTCLFLAMRGVMDLGGFVAQGGPYEIAHQAPDWWWIFPLSVIACVLIAFASFGGQFSGKGSKASLVAMFFWPAIFLSLGWNFLEYGFFKSEGLQWGWIICAVLFIVMGAFPLFIMLGVARRERLRESIRKNRGTLWPQILGIAAGIPLGILFFNLVS